MTNRRTLNTAVMAGVLIGLLWATFPPPAGAGFNVGAQLGAITPTADTTVDGTYNHESLPPKAATPL